MISLSKIKRKIKVNIKSIIIRDLQILIIHIINNLKILDRLISTIILSLNLVNIKIMIDKLIWIILIIIITIDKKIIDIHKNIETIIINNNKMISFLKIKNNLYNLKFKTILNKLIKIYFNRSIKILKFKIKLMFNLIKIKNCMK